MVAEVYACSMEISSRPDSTMLMHGRFATQRIGISFNSCCCIGQRCCHQPVIQPNSSRNF